MSINKILQSIEQAKTQKEKQNLIAIHADNELLKLVVSTTLDSSLNFYTKSVSETDLHVDIFSAPVTTTLYDFIDYLIQISKGKSCNNAQQNTLDTIYTQLSEEDKVVARQIVARKLRCGAGVSKWRDYAYGESFLPDWGCMLASQFDLKKIQHNIFKDNELYHAFSERKTDGQRCEYLGWLNQMFTRKGKEYKGFTTLCEQLSEFLSYTGSDYMIDGELVVVDEYNEIINRSEGNGLINKFVKGKGDLSIEPNILFIVWDMVPRCEWELCASSKMFYNERRKLLHSTYNKFLEHTNKTSINIELQHSIEIDNITDAIKHYQHEVNNGQEGTILKAWDAVWDPCHNSKRPLSQFKFKEAFECEFKITGYYDGEKGSRNEGLIGGFYIESEDGKIQCKCGSGLSDAVRGSDKDYWTGKIITVAFNALSSNKDNELYALQHPRFIEERIDKTEADTLERVLEYIEATRALALEQAKILGK